VHKKTNKGTRDSGSDYWVRLDNHRRFWITPGQSMRVGTEYFYGCTIWVVVGPRAIVFGHVAEEKGGCVPFESSDSTWETIIPQIEDLLEPASPRDTATNDCDRHAWIMGTVADEPGKGPGALKDWLEFEGVPKNQIRYLKYGRGGAFDANDPPEGPRGKGVVTLDAAADGTAVLKVFLSNEEPRLTLNLKTVDGEDGEKVYMMLPGMTTSTSSETT